MDPDDFVRDHNDLLGIPFLRNVWLIPGERRNSFIIHCCDGYFYHQHHVREHSNTIHLKCVKKHGLIPCRGRASCLRDGSHMWITVRHNHDPDFIFPEEALLRQAVLQRVASGEYEPYSRIIRDVGQRGRFSVEARLRVTLPRMRSSMRARRLALLPPIPESLPDLANILQMQEYRFVMSTVDGQDHCFAGFCGDVNQRSFCVVFGSKRLLYFLMHQPKVFADGTFKMRPAKPHCGQIFNISVTWRHHIIPCVRVLMQSRLSVCYDALFAFLKTLMPHWNPSVVMCDHERGQVNSWMRAFPMAQIETCLWHFAVCVFRMAKELGMHRLMVNEPCVEVIVRCCSALPMLPAERISEGLEALGWWARAMGVMRHEGLRDLFQYIHHEWIPKVGYLSVWFSEDRTNNVSESDNASISSEIHHTRPNVWEVIGAFVRLEDQAYVDLNILAGGGEASVARKYRAHIHDYRIWVQSYDLHRGYTDILTFLRRVSRTIEAPYNYVFN